MHLLHAGGTLSDRGRDPFDASAAHITDREYSRPIGLEGLMFDMVAASPLDRTNRCMCRHLPARYTAAWPAEFPPPTTITSIISQRRDSVAVAA